MLARLLFLSQTVGGGSYASKARTSASGLALIVCCLAGCGDRDVPSAPRIFSLSPKRAALTTFQTQQFQAIQRNDAPVSWEVDGVPGGNAIVGTITNSGLYSPPRAGGIHIVAARSSGNDLETAQATVAVTDLTGVFTGRYDRQRTGQNRLEYALTPATVGPSTFGKLFSCPVDGAVYAQPLYVANLPIAGGTHNVVFVATQRNSVYAIDADRSSCHVYWQRKFVDESYLKLPREITSVPAAKTGNTWDIKDEIGITGTPVIDPDTGTLYVVTKTREKSPLKRILGFVRKDKDGGQYHQRLHALSLVDGSEKFNGPAEISGALTVTGGGEPKDALCPSPEGQIAFCTLHQHQRPALLLIDGKVYIAWASHGDVRPHYHGWVIGYNASNLAEPPVLFNTSPNGVAAGIWHMAADDVGNIYVITGNGTFDTAAPRTNYGNTFVKLSTAGGKLSVADFFTPFNQEDLNPLDLDLGSGGPLVLPDSVGSKAHPRLLVGGDKSGQLYLVDRDRMGGYCDGLPDQLQYRAAACHRGYRRPLRRLRYLCHPGGMGRPSVRSSGSGPPQVIHDRRCSYFFETNICFQPQDRISWRGARSFLARGNEWDSLGYRLVHARYPHRWVLAERQALALAR